MKFRIVIRVINDVEMEVEANSQAEAIEKAMDNANFYEDEYTYESSKELRSLNLIRPEPNSAMQAPQL